MNRNLPNNRLQMGLVLVGLMALLIFSPTEAQDLNYTTSWIGNSFSGSDGGWVQNFVDGMFVTPDGTVYTNSDWDESGREVGIYRDGDVAAFNADLHGWGRGGGHAVTVDDRYLYVTMVQSGCDGGDDSLNENGLRAYPECDAEGNGPVWYAVRRYDRESLDVVSFDAGYGYDESLLVVDIDSSESDDFPLSGLATQDSELFVSSPLTDTIKVYSTQTLEFLREFAVQSPDELAFDDNAYLWVIQRRATWLPKESGQLSRIARYSINGDLQPQQIPLDNTTIPTALAFDNAGRLLVADNGVDQHIKIYGNLDSEPTLVDTFGVTGGVFSGIPGQVAPLKFHDLQGVGVDAAGNIYVGMGGYASGTELESYTAAGERNWRLLGLEFIGSPAVDPASDGVDVYTKHEHFVMDYDLPAGEQAVYAGFTLNPFRYPDDLRLHLDSASVFFRRIEGRPLMFVIGMYSKELQVYRFNPVSDGEIAIPSALFTSEPIEGDWIPAGQPTSGGYIWRDANGSGGFDVGEYSTTYEDNPYVWGWWVDDAGTVWRANREEGIRAFPLQGFDDFGNPIYTVESSIEMPNPPPFNEEAGYQGDINRLIYFPDEDTMVLSGYTADYPNENDDWGQVGSVIYVYEDWTVGNSDPTQTIILPYGEDNLPKAMAIAGDYIFVGYLLDARIEIFNRHSGDSVGTLRPDETVGSISGWLDLPYAISAFQRANGEYLIFAEEDAYAKIILYRWTP